MLCSFNQAATTCVSCFKNLLHLQSLGNTTQLLEHTIVTQWMKYNCKEIIFSIRTTILNPSRHGYIGSVTSILNSTCATTRAAPLWECTACSFLFGSWQCIVYTLTICCNATAWMAADIWSFLCLLSWSIVWIPQLKMFLMSALSEMLKLFDLVCGCWFSSYVALSKAELGSSAIEKPQVLVKFKMTDQKSRDTWYQAWVWCCFLSVELFLWAFWFTTE